MNPGFIWWNQIGSSLRFLAQVADQMRDHVSTVLQLPGQMPWREVFYEAVDARRAGFCASRSLRRLSWEPGMDPGELVLEELCSSAVWAGYWPGESVGAYLAALEDLVLNDYYVWVTGIHEKQDLLRWARFVCDYDHHCGGRQARAVFLLEYDGPETGSIGLDTLRCRVEAHDCRVFCLELAAALENSSLRTYQAELALAIGGADPTGCARLIETGEALLMDPVGTALEVMGGGPGREAALVSCVWRASIVLLFPVLEKFRMDFIETNYPRLLHQMPVTGCNGQVIRDPRELELGPLHHIAVHRLRDLGWEQMEDIRLCHRVRNLLAHNKPVPYEDVCRLLAWDAGN